MGIFIYIGIMEGKKSFLIYCDLIHTVKKMSNEDAWLLLKHMLEYTNDNNPEPPNTVVDLVFEPIKQQLKRDLKTYEKICAKNKENVMKRWNKKDTTVYDRIPLDTKHTDTDTDNDTDTDTDTDNDNDIKKRKKTTFSPPLQSEVEQYFIDNWYSIASARKAWNYYNVAWWKDWKGNAVKNRKQKMISVWFKEENRTKTQMKTLTPEEIAERNAR